MARLILLDRDGVLNADSPDFVRDVGDWRPLPGALDAVARLKRAGLLVGVCSNQSGIARGIVSEAALARIHGRLASELDHRGTALDTLRYCPHGPDDGCRCRKPAPGMLVDAMAELGVSPAETVFVGDSIRDVEAARAAGCRAALVRTGNGSAAEPAARDLGVIWVGDDLAAFAEWAVAWASC